MAEEQSEFQTGQKEIWEGLAKVFDGARSEAVKLPGGHELKHGEVWLALVGASLLGADALLAGDQTRLVFSNVYKFFTGGHVEYHPSTLEFLRDILRDNSKVRFAADGDVGYGFWGTGPAVSARETLRDVFGIGNVDMQNLSSELAKMEMHRQFRNITSWALTGAGFISGVLAVTDGKAKEKVVWSDTIGPLLARGIRAMNNVSEHS